MGGWEYIGAVVGSLVNVWLHSILVAPYCIFAALSQVQACVGHQRWLERQEGAYQVLKEGALQTPPALPSPSPSFSSLNVISTSLPTEPL